MNDVPKIRLELSKKLKKLRLEAGLTQEEMAERLSMDLRYYQRVESAKPKALKIDTLDKIARALNITPSKLLDF